MPRQIEGSQWDFSAGEVDVTLKRADSHPARKTGVRQCRNFRILNSGSVQNRSGRTALFLENGRVEQVLMGPGLLFYLAFGAGYLKVYNAAGAQVYSTFTLGDGLTAIPWTLATVKNIVWDIYGFQIFITYADNFPLNVPQILNYDGGFGLIPYTEKFIASIQKRTIFIRISDPTITLQPSATGGVITLTASSALFVPGHVGTRIRWVNKQIKITAYISSTQVTAEVQESLYVTQRITFATDPASLYAINDKLTGSVSGATAIVASLNPGGGGSNTVDIILLQASTGFTVATDTIVGPNGFAKPTAVAPAPAPAATNVWDDELMNTLRGYPTSVFVDQNRLGFCNFPVLPSGIAWSFIGVLNDLYPDPTAGITPSNAIFELAPRKSQVLYVMSGPESSEFVFCNNGIYYIPISATNPLKPGSVAFQTLADDGCANVQPRPTQDVIIYVNAGGNSMKAIVATGAFQRPFNTTNLNEFCNHLITNVKAIAAPRADTTFQERYIYLLNNDGSLVAGNYDTELGQIKGLVGWTPFSGVGTVQWIAAQAANVFFTTLYPPNVGVVERLDDTQYLDCAVAVNALPTAFTPPAGKGPLWFMSSQTVTLMDQVTRSMGTYSVDANGNIVPQNNGGENLLAASLVAGQQWTATLEPFAANAQPGADVHQRMELRQFSKFAAYVINSTGLMFATLFSAKQTKTSPALGTITGTKRVPAYDVDDDPTLPPTQRETVEFWSPTGSSYDPRVAIIKDTPGPLLISEIAMEITI